MKSAKVIFKISAIYSAMLFAGVVSAKTIEINEQHDNRIVTHREGDVNVNIGSNGILGIYNPKVDAANPAVLLFRNGGHTLNVKGGTVNGFILGAGDANRVKGDVLTFENATVNGGMELHASNNYASSNSLILNNSKVIADKLVFAEKPGVMAIFADGTDFSISGSEVINKNGGAINVTHLSDTANASNITDSKISATNGMGLRSGGSINVSNTEINVSVYPSTSEGVRAGELGGLDIYSIEPERAQLNMTDSAVHSKGFGARFEDLNANIASTTLTAGQHYGIGIANAGVTLKDSAVMANQDASGLLFMQGTKNNTVDMIQSHITSSDNATVFVEENAAAKISLLEGSGLSNRGKNAVAVNKNGAIDISANKSVIVGDVVSAAGGRLDVNLQNESTFQGAAENANTISMDSGSAWYLMGSSSVNLLNNNGNVIFYPQGNRDADGFKTLEVKGNYQGDNGKLFMNVQLGDDNSLTDKLIIRGDTSGQSWVTVNNLGGLGADTQKGIELIEVQGASNGVFKQDGRIVAGVYDYFLGRGTAEKGTSDSNWYLTTNPTTPPVDPIDPPVKPIDPPVKPIDPPVKPIDPPVKPIDPPVKPIDPPVKPIDPPVKPIDPPVKPLDIAPMRPEGASYAANLQAANTMFITNLHDRIGTTTYVDSFTGEQKHSSLWMKNEGTHTSSRDSSGQLKTKGNRYVLQLGGDLLQASTPTGNWRLGIMAGYGNQHTNTTTNVRDYGANAKGQIHGYSAGLYGSWYENDADTSGSYIDTWATYSWFKNSVQGNGLQREKYNSDGLTASIEGGYTFNVGNNAGMSYYVQPQAQAIRMGVKADDHKERTGAVVKGEGNNNVMTRLGVRAFMKNDRVEGKKEKRTALDLQPFVETNWLHNTQNYGSSMKYKSDERSIHQDGAKNILEVKLGVSGQINSDLSLWGSVGQQIGSQHFSETTGALGIKYNF
ncbi:TPA: autotransporter outer membrane beta-barrel domain-containing protein [Enterobacter hormaechei]